MEVSALKKIRVNIESSAIIDSLEVKVLPREILCIIFSYLDKKSVQNATGTCKLWFELIRSDKNLSDNICLEKFGLQQLSQKILIGEWTWARWPVLKTIKFGDLSAAHTQPTISKKVASYLSKLVCFKECPTLEKVVFSVSCTLTGIFPQFSFPHITTMPLGIIEELTFDPKIDIESVGIEHVSGLKLSIEGALLSTGDRAKDISQNLKILKETAHHLKNLTIVCKDLLIDLEILRICEVDLGEDLGEYKLLKNSFGELFEKLDETLESVHVVVGDASDIDTIFCDSTPITEISIVALSMCDIRRQRSPIYSKSDELTKLFHRFKKLKKCRIDLTLTERDEDQNCSTWPEFVNETFSQDSVDFKFNFIYNKQIVQTIQDDKMEVIRMPHYSNYVDTNVIRFEMTRR